MSELRTNRIVPRDGLPSGSSGGIIQVKSVLIDSRYATSSQTGSGQFIHTQVVCHNHTYKI